MNAREKKQRRLLSVRLVEIARNTYNDREAGLLLNAARVLDGVSELDARGRETLSKSLSRSRLGGGWARNDARAIALAESWLVS